MSVNMPSTGGLDRSSFISQLTSQGISEEAAGQAADRIDARGNGDGIVSADEARADYDAMVSEHGAENLQTVSVNFGASGPQDVVPPPPAGGDQRDPIGQAVHEAIASLRMQAPGQEVGEEALREALRERLAALDGFDADQARELTDAILASHPPEQPYTPGSLQASLQSLMQTA